MKKIIKTLEPDSFTQWKAQANDDWEPSYENLQNPEKKQLHAQLIVEQGALCCYCGGGISIDSSHIEHYRPQEHYNSLALAYDNLHASCLRGTAPGNPLHCGHKKGNWFDESLHISPLEETCELRFRYLFTGNILPATATDSAASKMIEVLALDISSLNNRRSETINIFFDENFLSSVSDEELIILVTRLRSKPPAEQGPFDHVIARFAEQLLS